MITSGEGKTKVWLKKENIGKDLLIIVGGGEKPHIGASVLCVPGKKCSILKYDNHKDDIVLTPIAKKACEKYKKTVLAAGGIHIEKATKNQIVKIIKNCKDLEDKV